MGADINIQICKFGSGTYRTNSLNTQMIDTMKDPARKHMKLSKTFIFYNTCVFAGPYVTQNT